MPVHTEIKDHRAESGTEFRRALRIEIQQPSEAIVIELFADNQKTFMDPVLLVFKLVCGIHDELGITVEERHPGRPCIH